MAAPRSPFSVGDLAYYHDPGSQRQCTVLIEAILEGYPPRRYQCTNMDTGNSFWSYGCWLIPILVDNKPWNELSQDILDPTSCDTPGESQPQAPKKARFVDLTNEQLDQMASSRISKHTQQQTTWGVKILRGESSQLTACYLVIIP